jgi:DNA-binding transcriptional ArsR family regulator
MQVETLVALGEPNRLRIVELLRRGPRSVGEIADTLALRQPQASKHLRVLSDARLLRVDAVSRRRIYRLNEEPFQDLGAWLQTFEAVWQSRLDSLESFLDRDGES